MASNSRQYRVIGGDYVPQREATTKPRYRPILPKQPVRLKILMKQPTPTAQLNLLDCNRKPTPPDLVDGHADPLLKDPIGVQNQPKKNGTSKVTSLMKSLWLNESTHYNLKNMAIFTSDIKHPIYCHTSILSMVSSYTKDLIESSGSVESDYQYSLCLPDISYDTMKHFLQRLYGLDDTECVKGYDVSEMNYIVAALGVKFEQTQLEHKRETESMSDTSDVQSKIPSIDQESENSFFAVNEVAFESINEFDLKNDTKPNEDGDGFEDFHLAFDSNDPPNMSESNEEELKTKVKEPGIEYFSVNQDSGQAKCLTCGEYFTTLDILDTLYNPAL